MISEEVKRKGIRPSGRTSVGGSHNSASTSLGEVVAALHGAGDRLAGAEQLNDSRAKAEAHHAYRAAAELRRGMRPSPNCRPGGGHRCPVRRLAHDQDQVEPSGPGRSGRIPLPSSLQGPAGRRQTFGRRDRPGRHHHLPGSSGPGPPGTYGNPSASSVPGSRARLDKRSHTQSRALLQLSFTLEDHVHRYGPPSRSAAGRPSDGGKLSRRSRSGCGTATSAGQLYSSARRRAAGRSRSSTSGCHCGAWSEPRGPVPPAWAGRWSAARRQACTAAPSNWPGSVSGGRPALRVFGFGRSCCFALFREPSRPRGPGYLTALERLLGTMHGEGKSTDRPKDFAAVLDRLTESSGRADGRHYAGSRPKSPYAPSRGHPKAVEAGTAPHAHGESRSGPQRAQQSRAGPVVAPTAPAAQRPVGNSGSGC